MTDTTDDATARAREVLAKAWADHGYPESADKLAALCPDDSPIMRAMLAFAAEQPAPTPLDAGPNAHDAALGLVDAAAPLRGVGGEVERLREALADPNAVHVNMLRGGIAKPSIRQIIHIYGADALRAALGGAA